MFTVSGDLSRDGEVVWRIGGHGMLQGIQTKTLKCDMEQKAAFWMSVLSWGRIEGFYDVRVWCNMD